MILSDTTVMLIMSLLILPYSLCILIGGLHIIQGRENIILLHYRFLFWILKLIRGNEYMRIRRSRFTNSSEYQRQGWYALIAGILLLAGSTLGIIDFLDRISP